MPGETGIKVGHLNHFLLKLSSVCDSFVYFCVIPALKLLHRNDFDLESFEQHLWFVKSCMCMFFCIRATVALMGFLVCLVTRVIV